MKFKCRASRLGDFMTGSKKKGELGETCKKVILDAVLLDALGYRKELDAKQIQKGLMLEDDAIKAVSLLKAVVLTKNKARRENEWFTGECDLLTKDSIRDTKCSWSIDSFPWTQSDADKKVKAAGYDWQGLVYMDLWQLEQHYVDFVLLPTPSGILGYNDDPYDHIELVNQIPLQKRIRSVFVPFDSNLLDSAKEKIESDLVQDYYQELYEQIATGEVA